MMISRLVFLTSAAVIATAACTGTDIVGPTSAPPTSAPPTSAMVIEGRAGYVAGVLGPGLPQGFRSVFVGVWRGDWGMPGRFCAQVLGGQDGSFTLDVPASCFEQGEAIYITAGGLATCVTTPFQSGERVYLEILGRWERCR